MPYENNFMKKNDLLLILTFLFTISFYGQESYYNDVNLNVTGLTLKEELASKIISTHTQFLFYDQIWDASKATDVNPDNNQEVLLIYGFENGSDTDVTNDRVRGIDNNSGASGDWNREHVYSQSLGTPALSDSGPGSDAHHLRPADAQRNSSRNNRKFTDGSGNSGIQSDGGWYPGDEWKGDVARMMMYMYVRYDDRCLMSNVGIGDNSATPDDMIDLFLKWNVEDPVSDFEKQRNTYHEDTANQNAQGNRNPFIDNPILATRIWGGDNAEDTWGIYTSSDNEAPTAPTNLSASNITTFSVDLTWDASTDNIGVTSYDVYVNNVLQIATSETSITIANLASNTTYSFAVLAKDITNNSSTLSNVLNVTTLEDIEAPTVPTNLVISNETESSFIVSWSASTDNTNVALYEVYVDNVLNGNTADVTYTVTSLTANNTYKIEVLAIDDVGNKSALSSPINGSTTNGAGVATELFFSEYVEGSSNNKALEIVNLTPNDIDLSPYSIKRQSNGGINGNGWEETVVLTLTGYTIQSDNTFVIVNEKANEELKLKADHIQPNASETNWGAPIHFNGNDPVGLFKNNILIDIIGTYNNGGENFAKDKTIRRKKGVSQPNTTFDLENEWDVYAKDNIEDIGSHSAIALSTNGFTKKHNIHFYPNPTEDVLRIQNKSDSRISEISIYNTLGKEVLSIQNVSNEISLTVLPIGFYLLKYKIENQWFILKLIKK